ncbi:MAG TPA: phosphatidate cytidylyltransferase, partial [Abditibacteriaceae bacterium]|nr:phosphatidate cytidylyltransferase [Abditibacteriaceae bacterium]
PRVATALAGIPCVALLVWLGGIGFNLVVVLLALLALRELDVAARARSTPLVAVVSYPAVLALLLAAWQASDAASIARVSWPVVWLVPLALLVVAVLAYSPRGRVSLVSVALTQLAILYVGLFAFLILLRARPADGSTLLWLALLGVWTGDTIAYYAGRAFGRRKLTPLSPGKTIEGALAGFVATIAMCVLVAVVGNIGWRHGLVMGVLIAFAAPLGDLAESLWKRELGVKDLGTLLPGHGGVLDRCDSLLFSVFVVYSYALWRM